MTDKKSSLTSRRVWRMSTETPMGSFVEITPPAAAPTAAKVGAAAAPTVAKVGPSEASKKVLTVPKPPSWLDSSVDLLTGCNVSDVGDTIPGDLFDELFGKDGDQR